MTGTSFWQVFNADLLRFPSLRTTLLCVVLLMFASQQAQAQDDEWNRIGTDGILSRDSITKNGFTLLFINKDSALNDTVKSQLIQTFFTVYPKEAKEYNKHTAKKVTFIIDPAYDGVAATGGALVRFNPQWFHKHPEDIDVVTHEVMHIVQAYHGGNTPGWLTEGIADYVRAKYGVDNAGAGWKLPDYSAKQNYTNAYRITARFLMWTEEKYNKKLVQKLDAALRNDTYLPSLWKKLTGKTVDDLWKEYGENPSI